MSNGITFIGENGGPLQFFDYSQHKFIMFYFACLKLHDINIISSTPINVLNVFITDGCRPALGGSTIAIILLYFPIIFYDISSTQSSIFFGKISTLFKNS